MAKTNFTKVEEALDEGMRKMTMQHLHSLADSLSSIHSSDIKNNLEAQRKLITVLKFELNWMHTHDISLHKKLGIKKSEISALLEKKEALTAEDFEKIKQLKEKIDALKKEMSAETTVTDDQLIEKERLKHVNKRFNVNDNWLPLQ